MTDFEVASETARPANPFGYGSLEGWYGPDKSEHLLDNPLKADYDQMHLNYATDSDSKWAIMHLPTSNELPFVGEWWNWDEELANLLKVIELIGSALGKFETHFVSATLVVNPLTWEVVHSSNNPHA